MPQGVPVSHNLGNAQLYRLLVQDIFLAAADPIHLEALYAYCSARAYRSGSQLEGALQLLVYVDALIVDGNFYQAGVSLGNLSQSKDLGQWLAHEFIATLQKSGEVESVFPVESIDCATRGGGLFLFPAQIPFKYVPYIQLFRELGVLVTRNDVGDVILIVEEPTASVLAEAIFTSLAGLKGSAPMSLADLKARQLLNERQGEEAENYVVRYELARLEAHPLLAKVRRISEENVSAGYDIVSFDSLASLALDRFIEVKSFANDERFFFSIGEYKTAEMLKNRYHIYLVNILRCNDPGYEPTIISDPVSRIFIGKSDWN